jgi:hypothetical protein
MKIGVKIFALGRNETLGRKLTENIYDDMNDAESYILYMIKALCELGFSVRKTETGYIAENKEFYTYEIVISKY